MGLIKPFVLGFVDRDDRAATSACGPRRHAGRRQGDDDRGRRRLGAVIAVDFFVTQLLISLMY